MKATLEFDVETERRDLELALAAPQLYAALYEIANTLRNAIKHGPLQPERETLEEVRRMALEATERLE